MREAADIVPRPFPGRYPTRIAYRIWVKGRKGTVDYCGKPSVEAHKRFAGLIVKSPRFVFYEFDRKGIIGRFNSKKGGNSSHVTLHRIYHPFSGADPLYTFKQPWTRKKISGFVAYYCPVVKLKKEQVEAHKLWLRSLGLIPQEPTVPKVKAKVAVAGRVGCRNCGFTEDKEIKSISLIGLRCENCGSFDVRVNEIKVEKNGL